MIQNPLEGEKEWLMPVDRSDYARVRLFMATAREDEVINLSGDGIDKLFYDGTHNGCIIRLDYRHAAPIYIDEIKRIKRKFSRIYLTNTAQTGKELILGITKSQTCDIVPEDETSFRSDADGFVSGRNQVAVIGGFYNETGIALLGHTEIGACKITDERELHTRALPPQMLTNRLHVNADAGSDTIAAPAAHYAIEVLGYQIQEYEDAALVVATGAVLMFATSTINLWAGITKESGVAQTHKETITGLRVRGAAEEALTLINADRTAGNGSVRVVVFYHLVRIN